MGYDPRTPNNGLKPIPVERLETSATLKKAISASRSLSALQAAGPLIPNQIVLLRAILLQEARASSEIENVVTTNDAIYRALDDVREQSDPATREVLRYAEALWEGFDDVRQARPIRASLAIRLAQTLKGADIGIRATDGCQIVNDRTGEVVYTPPVGKERILGMLDDLCQFMLNNNRVDPLIAMAAAHRQFEAIHPFPDGNGRTGRVLNLLFLVQASLLDVPVLYLSGHIVRNKSRYYELLREVTETGEWENWICFMLEAVDETAKQTLEMLHQVHRALNESAEVARRGMAKGYSRELIDVVFSQPYTRISHVEQAGIAKRNAASVYLRDLESLGILTSVRVGRERLFFNPGLMKALSQTTPADRLDL